MIIRIRIVQSALNLINLKSALYLNTVDVKRIKRQDCRSKLLHSLCASFRKKYLIFSCILLVFKILQTGVQMKILVTVKRVVDFNVKVRVKGDNTGIETANVKMSMNPFCEIAVEEAIRLKEKGVATEIIVASIGPQQCQETLRTALALGADRAILIKTDDEVQPLAVAKLLKAVVAKESPELVIMGKQSIDGDNNQSGQMLAALLDWPQGTFASEVVVADGKAAVTREIDGGLETISIDLPAIVTTDLRLNEPRFASLPNIMKAKRKQLDEMSPEDLGVDITPRVTTLKVEAPAGREAGIIVESVAELVDKLRNEAKVIS